MTITKYYQYRGDVAELEQRFSGFKRLNVCGHKGWHYWRNASNSRQTLDKMVFFIGKTGYGKSSAVNAISGLRYMETSDVEACTRSCQTLEYRVNKRRYLSIADLPGVGENASRDAEYRQMYRDFLQYAAAVVYLLRVDSRDFAVDLKVIQQLIEDVPGIEKRLLLVVGQCDKAEPISRRESGMPSLEQYQTIQRKIAEVERIFEPHYPVLACSSATGWNLDVLVESIVDVLNEAA